MKALQKNQGRSDQMLGALADMPSVAVPNQQWVSRKSTFVYLLAVYAVPKHYAINSKEKVDNTYGGNVQSLLSVAYLWLMYYSSYQIF